MSQKNVKELQRSMRKDITVHPGNLSHALGSRSGAICKYTMVIAEVHSWKLCWKTRVNQMLLFYLPTTSAQ